jgi:hypothetical protein
LDCSEENLIGQGENKKVYSIENNLVKKIAVIHTQKFKMKKIPLIEVIECILNLF